MSASGTREVTPPSPPDGHDGPGEGERPVGTTPAADRTDSGRSTATAADGGRTGGRDVAGPGGTPAGRLGGVGPASRGDAAGGR